MPIKGDTSGIRKPGRGGGIRGDTSLTSTRGGVNAQGEGKLGGAAVSAHRSPAGGQADKAVRGSAVSVRVPGAVTGLEATPGNTRADLVWRDPVDNGGDAVTSYTVVVAPAAGVVTITGKTAAVTGLTNGVLYTFTVKAVNSVGAGAGAVATATPA